MILVLFLVVVCLGRTFIQNTYAKFASGYETGNDITNLNLSFDVKISHLEEYEEITVDKGDYEVFNVNVKNSSSLTTYYGVWYMMASPREKSSDIVIAKSSESKVNTSGSIESGKDVTTTIIIKNNSSSNIKVNVGVASSLKSISDIEYLGGKKLISGVEAEADYYYDDSTSKYISMLDSSIRFSGESMNYSYTGSSQVFTSGHDGTYMLEAWGAQGGSYSDKYYGGYGGYSKGIISLKKNKSLYVYVGGQGEASCVDKKCVGGYNGGGYGGYSTNDQLNYSSGGGGATHIATKDGLLSSLSNNKKDILIVAGGGGGSYYHTFGETTSSIGGNAGGYIGVTGNQSSYSKNFLPATGGTQEAGGTAGYRGLDGNFGQGGNGTIGSSANECSSGGGGGYYGGGSAAHSGTGGGSSYIGNSSLINTKMYCYNCSASTNSSTNTSSTTNVSSDPVSMYAKKGNGYVKITPVFPTILSIDSISYGEKLAKKDILCFSGYAGCEVVKISDTSKLGIGEHTIRVVVKDESGYRYLYKVKVKVKPNTLLLDATGGSLSSGVTLTNLISNGGFENGIESWDYWTTLGGSINFSAVDSVHYSGNYSLKLNAKSEAMAAQKMSITTPLINHYYYGRTMFLSNSTYVAPDSRFEWYHSDTTDGNMIFAYKSDALTDWQLLSNLRIMKSDTYLSRDNVWFVRNFVVSANTDVYIDDNMIVDVTEGFGENIPSKDILDKISFFEDKTSVMILDAVYGEAYGDLPTPVKDGYTFLGWYTDPTGGVLVQSSDKISTNISSLYAHWK